MRASIFIDARCDMHRKCAVSSSSATGVMGCFRAVSSLNSKARRLDSGKPKMRFRRFFRFWSLDMTLDEYNSSVKTIVADQQSIAQETARLALSGQANPTNPEFAQLMTRQWSLVQEMAKLNTALMVGIMTPK